MEKKLNSTTIKIPKELAQRIKEHKITPRESYTEILERVLKEYKELKEVRK